MTGLLEQDTQFQDVTIREVEELASDYVLKYGNGWVLLCPKVEGLPAPRACETLRTYGRGIGYVVRGIVINGRAYRYSPPESV
jgi:hypothetical protein